MRIFITGGAGFIGSHLADVLLARGDSITALDNLSTGRRENIAHLMARQDFQFVEGSVLDHDLVEKCVRQCDEIYHLAAALHVKRILERPLEALKTNIHGAEIVLEAAARHRKKILIPSTSEIYGKNANGPLKEDDDRILGSPLKSRWGYSAAKGIDELLAYLYFKEQGLPAVIVRLFNTVGPRQTGQYGMVVPRFVDQALKGEDITVYGNGKQRRCFLHVKDAIAAMTQLMSHNEAGGKVFNVGGETELAIEDLAKKIIAMTGSTSKLVYIPYEQAYEEGFEDMQRRFPSTQRLRALTGWAPTMNLENILQSIIDSLRT